ncbi:Aste57867_17240 [Aphanomyces stellatus]|uniref:Aste57867_17240 protein n=1 Tax=Aphanomyces stellatus TaxID=120398 RepID=A0A485L7L3_9STRA|nr:hypothetical protein As57867_017181 [Aphanomyces stellatus]VFT93996.1 Aste57867_17240 [Aphanomyces stellatus]
MAKQEHPSFLLLGDSITQLACDPTLSGFHALLERDYIRRVDIVNRGLSGYNTTWTLQTLPRLLQDAYAHRVDPLLVTLFLGANDATPADNDQHVSITDFSANLRHILQLLRHSFPSAKLLLLTPPAISNSRTCGRTNAMAGEYAAACRAVGTNEHVPVIDLWTRTQGAECDSFFSDGLHLSAKGNVVVYEALTEAIATRWPEMTPDQLPFVFPSWFSSDPSLSGFASLLQHDYIRCVDIVNRGLSGYTTRWYLRYLDDILAYFNHRAPPLLVTLFLGANDANQDDTPFHVPLTEYTANLRTLVSRGGGPASVREVYLLDACISMRPGTALFTTTNRTEMAAPQITLHFPSFETLVDGRRIEIIELVPLYRTVVLYVICKFVYT